MQCLHPCEQELNLWELHWRDTELLVFVVRVVVVAVAFAQVVVAFGPAVFVAA